MHVTKIIIYGSLAGIAGEAVLTGLMMGVVMVFGSFLSNRIVRKIEPGKYQALVSMLLCAAGLYMLVWGG